MDCEIVFINYRRRLLILSANLYKFAFGLKHFTSWLILNRLKVVLVEQQKTGKWLAEQIGKSNCTVSKWCSNSVQPDLKTLNDIAKVLNIDVKDLIVSSVKP